MSQGELYKPQYRPWPAGVVALVFGPLIGVIFTFWWAHRAAEVEEPTAAIWVRWAIGSVLSVYLYFRFTS